MLDQSKKAAYFDGVRINKWNYISSEHGLKRYGAGGLSLDYIATLISWKLGISLIHSAACFDVCFAGLPARFL